MNNETVTRGIFYCRDSAKMKGCGSLQTSLRLDSVVLRNRQQKHTAIRWLPFNKNSDVKDNNLIIKLKKRNDYIGSLIEDWCKKKLVFAHPLLPFGTVRVANAHCTHLQIAQADTQTKICKRVQFLPQHTIISYTFISSKIKWQ